MAICDAGLRVMRAPWFTRQSCLYVRAVDAGWLEEKDRSWAKAGVSVK
jgi:hypothetical protein